MLDANRGDFPEPKAFGGSNPPMSCEDSMRSVDHDGPKKSEALDTLRDPLDLPLTVHARVLRIEL